MRLIELRKISKAFDTTDALSDIDLYIRKNEFLTLLGPSGCGKTTMLRIIAGFENPTSGKLLFDGADITAVPPYLRRVNTVFQKYALFPHLNVFDNIAFALKLKKTPKDKIKKEVLDVLSLVNLKGYEKRGVENLSGGQQQRVAIARALVNRPEVLLLDEPLGALDLKLRKGMQLELKRIQQTLGITFIYVTHDQEEAMTMSDTIVVMNDGRIQQIGTPQDIYNEPANAFVADFIGESNILGGTMIKEYLASFLNREFVCVDKGFGDGKPVQVVIRPEDVKILPANQGMLKGTVRSALFMGVHYELQVDIDGLCLLVHTTENHQPGDSIGLNILPDDIHIMRIGEQPKKDEA